MKYIRNTSLNPYYNLAFEEYVFKNFTDDEYLLLWQNDNTIVVGKNQNTIEEINQQAIEELSVKVVRRNTGGGAVYHDLGNVNFSYISDWKAESELSYERFLNPIIKALNTLGVEAMIKGRNDIVVQDRKISGNAQAVQRNRILHHGTLLFDSNLSMMQKVLNVSEDKMASKGVKSVKARVANIKEFLKEDITVVQFIDHIRQSFFQFGYTDEVFLSAQQQAEIEELAKTKYESWEWNYGQSPESNFKSARKFDQGKLEVSLFIKKGVIECCKIWGDFLSLKDVNDIEKALSGIHYEPAAIREVLNKFNLRMYFGLISVDEILSCFIE